MPVATIIAIADAVVAAINAGTFAYPHPVAAGREYVPVHELDDLVDLAVTVVPTGLTASLLDRGSRYLFDYLIDIGIQRRTEPTNAERDAMMYLVEQVVDLLRVNPLALPAGVARCVGVANAPIFVPQHLDEKRVFTSVVTLTYRLGR